MCVFFSSFARFPFFIIFDDNIHCAHHTGSVDCQLKTVVIPTISIGLSQLTDLFYQQTILFLSNETYVCFVSKYVNALGNTNYKKWKLTA